MDVTKFDAIDIGTGIGAVCFVAANFAVTPFFAVPSFAAWLGLHKWRRSKSFETWISKIAATSDMLDYTMPLLLPPPKEETSIVKQQLPPHIRNKDMHWLDRITQVKQTSMPEKQIEARAERTTTKLSAIGTKQLQAANMTTEQNMAKVLAIMPKHIAHNHPKLTEPPTSMSVLIGYDPIGKCWKWADFGLHGDTIHAFVGGQTRAGKDSEIRLWFTQLTQNNTPEDIQFIVIDAKGEWITPALKNSTHMYIPPVGGFKLKIQKGSTGKRQLIDLANESIEDAMIDTIELLQQRADEFQRVGATNLQAYQKKTGKQLPILFVIVTDIGTNLNGILEELVRFLVFKGGSLGVRAIISMQTASGEDTGWRGQMGVTMSGFQAQASADAPNMGYPTALLKYRPSQLPSVDVPVNRGLFVVRKGFEQFVVRGAYLPDDVFEAYCEDELPKKNAFNSNDLLASMLLEAPKPKVQVQVQLPKQLLTKEQIAEVVSMAKQNIAPSNITKALGFTSSARYAEISPIVVKLVEAVKIAQQKRVQR